jgi:hypothetical protein
MPESAKIATGPAEILVMSRVTEQTNEMKISAGLSWSRVGAKSIEIVQYIVEVVEIK